MKSIAIFIVCLTLLICIHSQSRGHKTGAVFKPMDKSHSQAKAGSAANADSDSDVDTNTKTNDDTETDTDNDGEVDADADADADTDTEADTDTDTEVEADANDNVDSYTNSIPVLNFIDNIKPDTFSGLGAGFVSGIDGIPSSKMLFPIMVKMFTEFFSKIKAEMPKYLSSLQFKDDDKKHDMVKTMQNQMKEFMREFIKIIQLGINIMKYELEGENKRKEYQQSSNKSGNMGNNEKSENHRSPVRSKSSGNGGKANANANSSSNSKSFSRTNQKNGSNDPKNFRTERVSSAASARAVST